MSPTVGALMITSGVVLYPMLWWWHATIGSQLLPVWGNLPSPIRRLLRRGSGPVFTLPLMGELWALGLLAGGILSIAGLGSLSEVAPRLIAWAGLIGCLVAVLLTARRDKRT